MSPLFKLTGWNVRFLMVLACLSLFVWSCDDDDDEDDMRMEASIVELAQDRDDLSSFTSALERASLSGALDDETEEYTVFAPNNAAFSAFLQANGYASLEEVPTSALGDLLLYHVVAGQLLANQLQTQTLSSLNGGSIEVNASNGLTLNGSARVLTPDLTASNGVIHIIDEVLSPAGTTNSVASRLTADPELSTLSSILQLPELADLLDAASNPDAELTVFAPTDAAFAATFDALGKSSIDEVPAELLREIVAYHILDQAVRSSEVSPGEVTSLQGESLSLSTDNGGVQVNGIAVVEADLEAGQGVIHIIEGVLLPQEPASVVGSALAIAYFSPDFTTLVAALKKAGLVSTLAEAEDLTIFAPDNAAFEAAGISNPDDLSAEELTPVLTYHVLGESILAAELQPSHTTLQGEDLYPREVGETAYINAKAQVLAADLEGDNGVVHVISRVLMPPSQTLAEIVIAQTEADEPEFSLLLAAVQHAGLTDALMNGGPFTVFAPTDAAFAAAGFADEAAIQAADPADIAAILSYHLLEGYVFSVELETGAVSTLQGGEIKINAENLTITDAQGGTANVDASMLDILATNGLIHVIDKVLLP